MDDDERKTADYYFKKSVYPFESIADAALQGCANAVPAVTASFSCAFM